MRKVRFWWFVAAWAVVIFLLSSIPGKAMPQVPALQYDKVLHALVYSVLGGLFFLALRQASSLTTARLVVAAGLFALGYGLTDELHQVFVPGRSADLYDALADGIGGLLGATIATRLPFARSGAPG
jgi:VanZ family protein